MEKRMNNWSTDSLDQLPPLAKLETPNALVVGTTQLFEDNGQIRYVPMPTPDPKDPLNLPNWRKWAAIVALCFFGALATAAETIVGALVPVFVLEYAGIDPKILAQIDLGAVAGAADASGGGGGGDPLALLSGLGGPPIAQVALLASLPLLVNGIASFFLVPLSTAIGRRPVLLLAGLLAWTGGFWAGCSNGLYSHLAARCFQGLGAGAVEALIPLIVQDIMFIHQRNKAISSITASQALIIVSLGITSPLIVARLSWRVLYFLTSGFGVLAWFGCIFFVPESRWLRTNDELAGKQVYPLRPGETRPRLDVAMYGPRTNTTDFGILHVSFEWTVALRSVWDTIRTTVFPNIFWVILVNSLFISVQGAAGQVGSTVLIAAGWRFETLGLAVLPVVVAAPFVWLFGGYIADKISNAHARRNGGRREPEAHLLSLIVPLIAGVAGPILFGYAAQNSRNLPSAVVLVGIFFIGFAFSTASTVFSVYLVESYPAFAGPVLVNVSSLRLIVGFVMSFNATNWIEQFGFLSSFSIYAGALAVASLGLPLVYLFGKRIRSWTAGRLEPAVKKLEDDDSMYERKF